MSPEEFKTFSDGLSAKIADGTIKPISPDDLPPGTPLLGHQPIVHTILVQCADGKIRRATMLFTDNQREHTSARQPPSIDPSS